MLAFHSLESLVAVRVELIAGLGQNFFNLSLLEGTLELGEGHVYAHFQRIEITALVEQRHFQIVFYFQQFFGKFLGGKFVGSLDFFLMAAA